jgi:hypothetical protein
MFAFALIALALVITLQWGLPDDTPNGAQAGRGAEASMPSIGGMPTGASAMAAEETTATGTRERMKVRDPRIRPFMIFGFAAGSLQAATGQAIGFFIIDRMAPTMGLSGTAATGLISIAFMAGAGATLLAQWGIIRLLSLSPSQLMRWGTLLAAVGTAGIALAPDFHAMVLAFALASAGFGFARPGFTAGSSLAVSRAEQGGVAGAVTAVNGACFILAPAIGIGLYELEPHLPYALGAIGLLALALYAWKSPTLRNSVAPEI